MNMEASKRHNLESIRFVIAVAAGKGGVGKSTVAVNLARYLAAKGMKVGLMDADLYGPSMRKMFPEEVRPIQHPENAERIIPAEAGGVKLMSMAYFLKEEGDVASVRAPIANGIIKQFIHLVEWGDLDYLIIDFPPGTGDIQLTLIQEGVLSGAILVATPQEVALLDVAKAARMFTEMQVPLVGLVENMSYYEVAAGVRHHPFGQGGAERFAKEYGIYFLGSTPIDPMISLTCDTGVSLFKEVPEGIAAQSFASVAEKAVQQLESLRKLEEGCLKNFDLYLK